VGLGMTDGDRRIANMRLHAGGEVTPDSARHMGLFVVGRLADRHGIRVRLRGSSVQEARSGSTAEIYLPSTVLAGVDGGPAAPRAATPPVEAAAVPPNPPATVADVDDYTDAPEFPDTGERNGSHSTDSSISLLPRRRPGNSGITGAPVEKPDRLSPRQPKPAPEEAEPTPERPAAQPVSNTSSFFGSRVRLTPENRQRAEAEPPAPAPVAPDPVPQPEMARPEMAEPDVAEAADVWTAETAAPSTRPVDDDLIYQRMLSEWLVDPHDMASSPDLDWQTVWDQGWSAAADVENVPVQARTDQGLPVRDPGARLVPGGADAEQNGTAQHRAGDDSGIASNGVRDPDAIRASMSSHFSGVRAGRSHARDTDQGPDHA